MSKKLLVGLGMLAAGASAALVASKKLTADQKDKLAMKVDETVLNGREKALKYNQYLQQFLEENGVDDLKEKLSAELMNSRTNKLFKMLWLH